MGKKDYCCCCWCFGLELLYGNCKTWCSSRFQNFAPATAITTRIHHPRGIPSNNKPKQEQRNTTSSYLAHAPSSSSSCFLFSYLLAYAFINKLFHVPHSLLESLPKSQTLKLRRKNLLLLNIIIFFLIVEMK